MQLNNGIRFVKRFVRNPRQTGAVWPSSPQLAQTMMQWIDWPNVRHVVEFGPGDGVFTEQILANLSPDAKLIAIELNPDFAAPLAKRFPQARICREDVAKVDQVCEQAGVSTVDAILSGLPWACFGDAKQRDILEAGMKVLKPGGQFVTFAYLQGLMLPTGRKFRQQLDNYFEDVQRSEIVWRNVPPAFVYRCRKRA